MKRSRSASPSERRRTANAGPQGNAQCWAGASSCGNSGAGADAGSTATNAAQCSEVHWQAEGNYGDWISFASEMQAAVHDAYVSSESGCYVKSHGWEYHVDLKNMVQTNLTTHRKRRIRFQVAPGKPLSCTQCRRGGFSNGESALLRTTGGRSWLCTDCAIVYRAGLCDGCGASAAWRGAFCEPGGPEAQRWLCTSCWRVRSQENQHRGAPAKEATCLACGDECTDRAFFMYEGQWRVHAHCLKEDLAGREPKRLKAPLDAHDADSLRELWQWCPGLERSGRMICTRDFQGPSFCVSPLRAVPPAWMQFHGLIDFQVQCQRVSELPKELASLSSLRNISIAATPLRRLPCGLGSLTQLETLWISGTCLECVPEEVAVLQSLVKVNLNANALRDLPCFTSPKLRSMNAAGNRLSAAADWNAEGAGVCLKAFRLNGNRLTELPAIGGFHQLEELDVGGNALVSLSAELTAPPFKYLQWLFVAQNAIQELPEAVLQLSSLEVITAFSNRLTELPAGILGMPKLRQLSVECNPLTAAALRSLLPLPHHSQLKLGVDWSQVDRWARSLLSLDEEPAGDAAPDCSGTGDCSTDSMELPAPVHTAFFRAEMFRKQFAAWPPRSLEEALELGLGSSGRSTNYAAASQEERAGLLRGDPFADELLDWVVVHSDPDLGARAAAAADTDMTGDCKDVCGSEPTPRHRPRMLVVAFSASHASGPEWLGVLSQMAGKSHGDWARWALPDAVPEPAFEVVDGFWQLWKNCQTREWMAADCFNGLDVAEFDVLSTVDAGLHWYADERAPAFERRLARITRRYERCLFLGSSMGGFGALLYSYLADAVYVFSPQVSVADARLRPGADGAEEWEELTARVCRTVEEAQTTGKRTKVVVHCTMDEYFFHALQLPLPPEGLVLHPVTPGRPFSRVLRDTGLLSPIVARAIWDLQCAATEPPPKQQVAPTLAATAVTASPPCATAAVAGGTPPVLRCGLNEGPAAGDRWLRLACWMKNRLQMRWATLRDVLRLCEGHPGGAMPACGDWFCGDGHHNSRCEARCTTCFSQGRAPPFWVSDESSATIPGATQNKWNDWGCGRCGWRSAVQQEWCFRCGEECSFEGARSLTWQAQQGKTIGLR